MNDDGEEKILMSDDLLEVAETKSMVDGTITVTTPWGNAVNQFTGKMSNGPSSIGYPPLAHNDELFYFVITVQLGEHIFSGTASKLAYHEDGSVSIQILLGNEDYFRLVSVHPNSSLPLEVKLVDPMGNHVDLLSVPTIRTLNAVMRRDYVEVYFHFFSKPEPNYG
jgi:hypothetical protein